MVVARSVGISSDVLVLSVSDPTRMPVPSILLLLLLLRDTLPVRGGANRVSVYRAVSLSIPNLYS